MTEQHDRFQQFVTQNFRSQVLQWFAIDMNQTMSTFAVSNCCCCLFAAKNLHRNLGILGFRHFETFKVESSLLNNKIQCPQSNVSPKELANRMGCPSFVYVNNIRNRRQILYTTTNHSGSLGVLLVCWRRLRSATLLLTLAAYFACGMQIDLYDHSGQCYCSSLWHHCCWMHGVLLQ